jgi:hypothetical protein
MVIRFPLWLLRDESHIEAIDLHAIPRFAPGSALGHQLKFFGERALRSVAF